MATSPTEALDKLPVEHIRRTISALHAANQDAFNLLQGDPEMIEYIHYHQTVADALEAYCDTREGGPRVH